MKFDIDTASYPLFDALPDPEGFIRKLLDKEYSIFKSQHAPQAVMDVLDTVQTRVDDVMDSIQDSADKNAAYMVETLARVTGDMHAVMSKVTLAMANSSKKGKIAETCGDELLKELGASYTIINTSEDPKSGDRRITKKGFDMLLDWKDYARNVGTKEVDKLKRDMIEQGIQCGMICNLQCGVVGYNSVDVDVYTDASGSRSIIVVLGGVRACPVKVLMGIYMLESLHAKLEKGAVNAGIVKGAFEDVLQECNTLMKLVKSYADMRDAVQKQLNDFNNLICGTIQSHVTMLRLRLD